MDENAGPAVTLRDIRCHVCHALVPEAVVSRADRTVTHGDVIHRFDVYGHDLPTIEKDTPQTRWPVNDVTHTVA